MTLSFQRVTIITLIIATVSVVSYMAPVTAQDLGDAACEGITAIGGTCEEASSNNSVANLLKQITNILLFLVGAVSAIMIIVGGLRFIFSNGDAQQAANARNTVLYSVVGVVVAASAYGIINFVVSRI